MLQCSLRCWMPWHSSFRNTPIAGWKKDISVDKAQQPETMHPASFFFDFADDPRCFFQGSRFQGSAFSRRNWQIHSFFSCRFAPLPRLTSEVLTIPPKISTWVRNILFMVKPSGVTLLFLDPRTQGTAAAALGHRIASWGCVAESRWY